MEEKGTYKINERGALLVEMWRTQKMVIIFGASNLLLQLIWVVSLLIALLPKK